MPHLSQFIRENREEILEAWEIVARELPSANAMDVAALRDHAGAMLDAIAGDLETPQTEHNRAEKSLGRLDHALNAKMTAASEHGLGRAEQGFSVASMLAEFRALRSSVIMLWRKTQKQTGPDELEEMTRFNEAIDQAIAESMARYAREVEDTRGRVLAVLGHDLRTPLGVIVTSTHFLLETAKLTDEQRRVVEGMERSGRRMIELVRDLLDVALTRLGSGLPLERARMDMHAVIRDAVAEANESDPRARIEVETHGDLAGEWDGTRLAQALGNLVGNATQHGSRDAPIKVTARGEDAERVVVSVTNHGPVIPRERISGLFAAMKGGPQAVGNRADQEHLGLGLYIVDKIVEAHGGKIDVSSSEAEGTTFALTLPRRAPE